jgi:type III secretion system YscQ/HrcQ family protein
LFFEYAEYKTLSRRLRRLAPEAAAALRDLFREREYLVLDGDPVTTWRFGPAHSIPPPAAILDGVHDWLSMSIADDGWCEPLGARAWWDFTGESRLLAWALAHSGLLEGLGRVLREPLMPSALTAEPLPHSETYVPLSFSAKAADGRETTGCVSMSAAMVARLVSHAGWQRTAAGPAAAAWLALPGTLRVELRGTVFRLSELSASEIGDVLILGNRTACWRKLNVALVGAHGDTRLRTWNASYDGTRLTVISPAVLNSPMELLMSDPKTGGPADNIPVSLDFDLGTLALPLGELAVLKPGYVFELPGSLEKLRVVIRANGTRVGLGELVAVGDVLGVQLLALEIDGLR